jgi:hypothetical protein
MEFSAKELSCGCQWHLDSLRRKIGAQLEDSWDQNGADSSELSSSGYVAKFWWATQAKSAPDRGDSQVAERIVPAHAIGSPGAAKTRQPAQATEAPTSRFASRQKVDRRASSSCEHGAQCLIKSATRLAMSRSLGQRSRPFHPHRHLDWPRPNALPASSG